ncbi:probable WRKY transcription factor 65 isoform X2 [Carica papaya]|uniref:probable WRKY transcription factor 65 isoform X2 n=1 Tax=Carica papaya TaxID=3649 RepID=UPI000B8CC978|nr:probable WRKY transcription factor 65 isoform X2 [Carica papaya]
MPSSFNTNPFMTEQEDNENRPENGPESPPSNTYGDGKITSVLSPKRRKSIQKRVVSVPIKEVEGSRLKGETAPPSDSWAWRKYGQKPIKGSPYPRGYYRCSSSKGCPARKQVERSRVDPTMLLITYSCEHNHPWPASRNSTSKQPVKPETAPVPDPEPDPDPADSERSEPEEKFTNLGEDSLMAATTPGDEFTWFSEMETTSSTVLESPIFAERTSGDADVAMFIPMREEDESLFADLDELPECSMVFRHRNVGSQVEIC